MRGIPKDTPVHFVGIGGIGMSGLARILLSEGYRVTGSELVPNDETRRLEELGAIVWPNHRADYVAGTGLVVVTSAVTADNPEVQAALGSGIPVLKRAELLGLLTGQARTVAVAGTHGKTTTASLMAYMLHQAGWQPTYVLGGESVDLGSNAQGGSGEWAVVEADEYDRSFFHLHPEAALVTNIEFDHPDYYGDLAEIEEAFRRFLTQVEGGPAVLCADSPASRALALETGGVTYGLREPARWRMTSIKKLATGGRQFRVAEGGRVLGPFSFHLLGQHNLQNALGAVALASLLGVPEEAIRAALATFSGARRRFEHVGEAAGVTLIDDYAHHPSEIGPNLAAARERFPQRRLWAVFQPHTFSRTQALLSGFAGAFEQADRVMVTDIYPAREKPSDWKVHSRDVVAASSHPAIRYGGSLAETRDLLLEELEAGDVVLTMGAGDVWKLGKSLLALLSHRSGSEEPEREPGPAGE